MRPIYEFATACLLAIAAASPVAAAECGNNAAGFNAWKPAFAKEAAAAGVGQKGLDALASAKYASSTISADRNQKSFKYSLNKFMQVRGADTIVAQGRKRKARDAQFYQSIEARYGIPAGVIIAIHGMETAFGGFMGDTSVVSAITTLTYDCRRSDFFAPRDRRFETGRRRGNYRCHQRCQTRRTGPYSILARQCSSVWGGWQWRWACRLL